MASGWLGPVAASQPVMLAQECPIVLSRYLIEIVRVSNYLVIVVPLALNNIVSVFVGELHLNASSFTKRMYRNYMGSVRV